MHNLLVFLVFCIEFPVNRSQTQTHDRDRHDATIIDTLLNEYEINEQYVFSVIQYCTITIVAFLLASLLRT